MLSDTPVFVLDNVECRSLKAESWHQACSERWIRSEREGRDMGEFVIQDWIHKHWPGFVRARWIEHMQGERFWLELDREEFGLFRNTPVEVRPLLDYIIDQLKCGGENLTVILWMLTRKPEELPVIRELLRVININAHRLRCHFAEE